MFGADSGTNAVHAGNGIKLPMVIGDSCLISITGRGSWLSPYGRLDEQHAVMPDNPADWPLERLDQHEASVSQFLRDDFLGNPVPTSIRRYPRWDRLAG